MPPSSENGSLSETVPSGVNEQAAAGPTAARAGDADEQDSAASRARGSHIKVPEVLVGNRNRPPPNTLEQGKLYAQLRRNDVFEARPAVVHFSGFQLHVPQKQKLRLLNIGQLPRRANILQPTTKFFKFHYEKKGHLAMGMAEKITIEFTPTEWRYYYDCIRVHCDGGNLLIPIHAYPIINEVIFPRELDFGVENPLLDEVVKVVEVRCKVPIDFEYALVWLTAHPDIWVEPMEGIIPAQSSVEVAVHYKPSEMSTARAQLLVNVSQFGFEPFACTITGTCKAGVARRQLLQQIGADVRMGMLAEPRLPLETFESDVTLNRRRIEFEREVALSKMRQSGQDPLEDPFALRASHQKSVTTSLVLTVPKHPPKPADVVIEGIRFPANLAAGNMRAVTYVMTQEAGKLKLCDLKDAIALSQEQRKKDMSATTKGGGGAAAARSEQFADEVEDEGLTRQMREFKFEQAMRERVAFEKGKETKQLIAIGDVVLTEAQVAEVWQARQENAARLASIERHVQRNTAGVSSDAAERSAPACDATYDFAPSYDVYRNDGFKVRSEVLNALLFDIRKLLVRKRVDRRIAAIREKMEQSAAAGEGPSHLNQTSTTMHTDVDDSQSQRSASRARSSTPHASNIDVSIMHDPVFSTYVDANFRDRTAVDVFPIGAFDDWQHGDLRVPQQYKITGHVPQKLLPRPSYVKTFAAKPIRFGAHDEETARPPRGPYANVVPAHDAHSSRPIATYSAERAPAVVMPAEQRLPSVCAALDGAAPSFRPGLAVSEGRLRYDLQPFDRLLWIDPPARDGEGSLRALAETERLSGSFVNSLDLPTIFTAPLPSLLAGPLAEDEMSDDDDDEASAKLTIIPPLLSPEQIVAQFLPRIAAARAGADGPADTHLQGLVATVIRQPINVHERTLDARKCAVRNKALRMLAQRMHKTNGDIRLLQHKLRDMCDFHLPAEEGGAT